VKFDREEVRKKALEFTDDKAAANDFTDIISQIMEEAGLSIEQIALAIFLVKLMGKTLKAQACCELSENLIEGLSQRINELEKSNEERLTRLQNQINCLIH
jgi:N-acetylglucosamine kinase-like BadF-type ATPase